MDYDYIIVGAGSAGCTLAGRLTENRSNRVLLLEAGGWDRDPRISIPLGFGHLYTKKLYDWHFSTAPEPQLNNRTIEFARGKVIGGSSSTNAMAYVRGNAEDYNRWAASGLDEWSYNNVLPYFRKQEGWRGASSTYHGTDGPLTTQTTLYADPLVDAVVDAGAQAGLPWTDDYNGANQEGLARLQSTIRDGRRCSAAVAYLRPALSRSNLNVVVRAFANRILFDDGRATGIEYEKDGQKYQVRSARVILAGGVVNSPQLLMLSGIGDPDELHRHAIAPRVSLRGVGGNLQDHLSPVVSFVRKPPGPLFHRMRYDRIATDMFRAHVFGSGMAAEVPCGVIGFLKSDSSQAIPDIQLILNPAPLTAKPYLTNGYTDGFGFRVVMLRPKSRGSISLQSADPKAAPFIRQNFLTDPSEWQTLRAGIRIVRDLVSRGPIAEMSDGPLVVPEGDSDAQVDAFIRANALTTHHPAGTCKMGRADDPLAVVDQQLRVFGVDGLYVIDASVMPDMVGGNINAPVMMIAEKAADLLQGRTTAGTDASEVRSTTLAAD